ncbi:gliding motility lipoprotein GldD [Mucilaginibacter myungsuensis]|uniref:Gliding motility lipoprotein GldD n=1 Tax=Mucilaginibacter myungsuensis TaxID=649104 RepID=A0A929L0J5_9SPHI|nr:gliding motility lipoprotein GldD [Mucilaginibacter myungsuensis]MBE9664015.1 gliding motility lipoprotein GldD [Mucilaginibacter myungsuensis]MDN3601194.1 gliding motility lipoprotein GldD [Mucilaginibacter myungsuensis]
MRGLFFALIVCLLCSCGDGDYSPKPRGYFRIPLPKKEYQDYTGGCPFYFKYPTYAFIEPDRNRNAMPCWLNVQFPQFNGTLHLTYEPVANQKIFNMLVEDSYKLASKHTVKATSIDQAAINNSFYNVFGVYYSIEGNVASSAQFFLTDSTNHYIRGSLYFNVKPRIDSIQPVMDFVKKDLDVMIKSFRWKQ